MIEIIFQFLLAYGGKYFTDVLLVAMFGMMLYYTYKSKAEAKQTKESVDRLESYQMGKVPALSSRMKYVVKKSATVNRELDSMTGDLEADRGWLYLFHNMGYDFLGQPFAKVTNTNESVGPGIDSRIGQMRDVPIGLMSCFVDHMITHGQVYYPDVENLKETDKTAYNYLKEMGVKSTYAVCLFAPRPQHMKSNGSDRSSKGDIPIGFVGVDYIRDKNELDHQKKDSLHNHAMIIKGLLMERRRVELDGETCVMDEKTQDANYKVDNY